MAFSLWIKPIMPQQLMNGLQPLSEQSFPVDLSSCKSERQQELPSCCMQSLDSSAGNTTMHIIKKERVTARIFIASKVRT